MAFWSSKLTDPDGVKKVLLIDHTEGQCRCIIGFKHGDTKEAFMCGEPLAAATVGPDRAGSDDRTYLVTARSRGRAKPFHAKTTQPRAGQHPAFLPNGIDTGRTRRSYQLSPAGRRRAVQSHYIAGRDGAKAGLS